MPLFKQALTTKADTVGAVFFCTNTVVKINTAKDTANPAYLN